MVGVYVYVLLSVCIIICRIVANYWSLVSLQFLLSCLICPFIRAWRLLPFISYSSTISFHFSSLVVHHREPAGAFAEQVGKSYYVVGRSKKERAPSWPSRTDSRACPSYPPPPHPPFLPHQSPQIPSHTPEPSPKAGAHTPPPHSLQKLPRSPHSGYR